MSLLHRKGVGCREGAEGVNDNYTTPMMKRENRRDLLFGGESFFEGETAGGLASGREKKPSIGGV